MKGRTILFFQEIYQNAECVPNNALEATLTTILVDIDVGMDFNPLEACLRFGNPERTIK